MYKVHGLLYNNITFAILSICGTENFVLMLLMLMLSTISKCFSVLTTLLISSNPLTRVEEDALVFNQVEGAFGRLIHSSSSEVSILFLAGFFCLGSNKSEPGREITSQLLGTRANIDSISKRKKSVLSQKTKSLKSRGLVKILIFPSTSL